MSKARTRSSYLGIPITEPRIDLLEGDLSPEVATDLEITGKEVGLAVDIETTGLVPTHDRIEVISLSVPRRVAVVTMDAEEPPHFLGELLQNGSILKVLHHALFDLSFFRAQWGYLVEPVFCTKVAARVAGVAKNPTLKDLTAQFLGIELSKLERLSNWQARPLTPKQIDYAASDVRYLHPLHRELKWRLADEGRTELFEACMSYLPSRVELGMLGLDDVFIYQLPEQ